MERTVIYRYLGTNGVIDSPVHLEDIYHVRLVQLMADKGKMMTNGTSVKKVVKVPEEEEASWYEILEEDM